MTTPLVSICIPCYNAEKYIAETLDCLLEQSYPNIEIIATNDGSTDNTLKILNAYKKKGLTILNQPNQGQCAAANTSYKSSKGNLIKFMDADDLISPDFIEKQVEIINGRKDVIASAEWGRFYKDDLATLKLNPESVWRNMKPIDWLAESLSSGHNMMQCGLWLIPRVILEKSGLWDQRLSLINDFDFFIRVLLQANEINFTSGAILYYRSGISNSLSAQKTKKAIESAYLSSKLGIESILSHENSERTRKICADYLQLWKYQFYPKYPDLLKKTEKWIEELGGSQFDFPAGGKTKILRNLFGWRIARWVNYLRHAY